MKLQLCLTLHREVIGCIDMDASYWDRRYINRQTGWDIGYPSPAIINYFESIEDKSTRILIPGAGNAYEVEYLYKLGFTEVHLLDYSEIAISNFKNRCPSFPLSHIHCEDFFDHNSSYDLIIEQTFFCALVPDLRPRYVSKMNDLLLKGGKLIGLLFDKEFAQNPPYGGSEIEYRELFKNSFEIIEMSPCRTSIPPRMGSELFVTLKKRYS